MARTNTKEQTEPKVAPEVLAPEALEFGEPPASGRAPRPEVQQIVAALKARPGEWAKIVRNASLSTATRWRKQGLEVRSDKTGREDGDTRVDLWARYVEPVPETEVDGEVTETE